jgi:peptidoglycan/xylan/chitin deacetylase (PgdA/CDA1 family)
MAYLLLGYDIEATDSRVTRGFIDALRRAHGDLEAPGTLFLRGETLVASPEAVRATLADDLFEYGQHTWSHVRFKTLWQVNEHGEQVFEGATFGEIARDIERAQTAVYDMLGVTPVGLTTPWGCYRGLGDRPDLLSLL